MRNRIQETERDVLDVVRRGVIAGLKHGVICDHLPEQFPERKVPNLRKVQRLVQDIKDVSTNVPGWKDEPFAWHRMAQYEIPWEASPIVMELVGRFSKGSYPEQISGLFDTPTAEMATPATQAVDHSNCHSRPTACQVIWFWRVRQILPHHPVVIVELLSARFAFAELGQDIWGRPMQVEGLERLLTEYQNEESSPAMVLMERLAASGSDHRIPRGGTEPKAG